MPHDEPKNEALIGGSELNAGLDIYRCDQCMYWRSRGNDEGCHPDDRLGECKRYPPQRDPDYKMDDAGEGSESNWTFWEQPTTEAYEWCGEFKPVPNVKVRGRPLLGDPS